MKSLLYLDISDNPIYYIDMKFLDGMEIRRLITSSSAPCCVMSTRAAICTGWNSVYQCTNLIPSVFLMITSGILIIFSLCLGISAVIQNFPKHISDHKYMKTNIVAVNMSLSDMIAPVTLIMLIVVSTMYTDVFPYHVHEWTSDKSCMITGSLLQLSIILPLYNNLLFIANRFYFIYYPLYSRKHDAQFIFRCAIAVSWIFLGSLTFAITYFHAEYKKTFNTNFNLLCMAVFENNTRVDYFFYAFQA